MSVRRVQFAKGEYYHLYTRGVEKRKIFLDDADRRRFMRLLYSANSDLSVHLSNYQGKALLDIPRGLSITAIGAWCLMPNHLHLLVKETKENGISEFMQKLLTGYSMYFNKKYQRTGSLFESKFNAKHLDTDQYLKYQYTYIHLNPVGIVDAGWKKKKITNITNAKRFISTYPYSSYLDYEDEEREERILLQSDVFPNYFTQPQDFEAMVDEWLEFSKARP
jgi:REP element-mobilizing transposase RayT